MGGFFTTLAMAPQFVTSKNKVFLTAISGKFRQINFGVNIIVRNRNFLLMVNRIQVSKSILFLLIVKQPFPVGPPELVVFLFFCCFRG